MTEPDDWSLDTIRRQIDKDAAEEARQRDASDAADRLKLALEAAMKAARDLYDLMR